MEMRNGRSASGGELQFGMDRDLLCTAGADGIFTSLNAAWERLLGWSREELMSRPFVEFVHPDDVQRTVEAAARITEADFELVEFENRYRTKAGQWRWLRWQARTDGTTWFAVAFDVNEQKEAEARLRSAVLDDRLLAFGQPIMDLHSGHIVQEELLVRMLADEADADSPAGGADEVLSPADFLPDAERLGLIGLIDRYMVGVGLARARRGHATEVNLSAQTMTDEVLAAELVERVRAAGDAAQRLVFEITETAAIENLDAACDLSEQLVRCGCRFALDDFGTGYGSLTQLRELPVALLKIDCSFVTGLAESKRDQALVRSIVAIAGEFGMLTVAEGVEDAETLTPLRRFGTDMAQGFLIGRPRPLSPMSDRFDRNHDGSAVAMPVAAAAGRLQAQPVARPQLAGRLRR